VGTNEELLKQLQFNRPFVTMKIDGREGLQRVLSTALHHFGWSCDHMYTAKMSKRGKSNVGTQPYQDIFMPYELTVLPWFSDDMYRDLIHLRKTHTKNKIDSELAHLTQWERGGIFDDVYRFLAHRLQLAPVRTFTGSCISPETEGFSNPYDCDQATDKNENRKLCLSLIDLALIAGDRIHYKYDFGTNSTFIAKILECKENQPLLPEILCDHVSRNVRATMVGESTNKIRTQYQPMSTNCWSPYFQFVTGEVEDDEGNGPDY